MFEQHASDVELPDDLRRAVEDELDRDERLYWTAQPIPGRLAMKTLPIMLFAIPWTGFAVFWMAAASGFGQEGLDGPGMCFTLFGLPFVLIGLGMFSAPYWVYRKAGRSAYAITDRRAILLDAGWFGGLNVRSFGPDELDDITRKQRADGSGDLIFRRDISHTHDSTHTRDIGFMAIRNVKDVETIIRTMVETARTNSAGPEAS